MKGGRFESYVVYSGETNDPDGPSVNICEESHIGATSKFLGS